MTTLLHVDVANWKRKELYEHYKDYDDPFFNLCTQVDVTELVSYTKGRHYPFSLCLVYLSLRTANRHESFRYRILTDKVVVLNQVHAAMTVLHDNEYFDFCYFQYNKDFFEFLNCASNELDQHMEVSRSLRHVTNDDDVIHYSILPWISFSNLTNARDYKRVDSVPKIVFGKYQEQNNRLMLPISIEVNHALMDGIHVARYLEDFQQRLNHPTIALTMAADFPAQAAASA